MDYSKVTFTMFVYARDIKEESLCANNSVFAFVFACVCVTHSKNLFGYRSMRIRKHKPCLRVLS